MLVVRGRPVHTNYVGHRFTPHSAYHLSSICIFTSEAVLLVNRRIFSKYSTASCCSFTKKGRRWTSVWVLLFAFLWLCNLFKDSVSRINKEYSPKYISKMWMWLFLMFHLFLHFPLASCEIRSEWQRTAECPSGIQHGWLCNMVYTLEVTLTLKIYIYIYTYTFKCHTLAF